MRAHLAVFKKKDGSLRTMRFVSLDNLPEDFFTSQTKNPDKKLKLAEGSSLVWDLDKQNFRVFNKNTIIGEIEAFNVESFENSKTTKTN